MDAQRELHMAKPSLTSENLDTLQLEGALFVPDLLEKVTVGEFLYQKTEHYQLLKGLKLRDEYSRSFQIAQAQWKSFSSQALRRDVDDLAVTRAFVREFLRDALAYSDLQAVGLIDISERGFPIDFLVCGRVPVVIVKHTLSLDEPDSALAIVGGGVRKKSVFQLAQEFLNASPLCTWGLVCNGRKIRLLRDAATLTRPCFLEFDLENILAHERYPEFAALWRVLHASRAGVANTPGTDCIWEQWRIEGQQQGTRVREGLRYGVAQALMTLGEGFLQHPANASLRQQLYDGSLDRDTYFQELLRLVYRFIFLFTVEERDILHPPNDSHEAIEARRVYAQGYAMHRLRDRCLRHVGFDAYDDLWQGVGIVFRGLAQGQPLLALPALGGLFSVQACRHLDECALSNRALLTAMRFLRWSRVEQIVSPIDYRNMGPEELGSVYESLLELVPVVDLSARRFQFIGLDETDTAAGNARKLTGSYYTPDSLVQELLKTALDPVIDAKLAAHPEHPVEALLSLSVIDPACGSGHFLLAAARRLAERLAVLRAPEGAVQPEHFRRALRDVISRCIYGVDRNPLAIELARTALWLEGFEPGRPLFFLEHHLICGDSLLGITHFSQLDDGIPNDAFKALSGDSKTVCRYLGQENRTGLKAFAKRKTETLQIPLQPASFLESLQTLEALPNDTPAQIEAKAQAHSTFLQQVQQNCMAHAADMFLGAFLFPKADDSARSDVSVSGAMFQEMYRGSDTSSSHLHLIETAQRICRDNRVLHWPITFATIFERGGFDCVLGNPPWERIKLQEQEFFASRHPAIATAKNKAERGKRIDWLSEGTLAQHLAADTSIDRKTCEAEKLLYAEFIQAKRTAEAASLFAHLDVKQGGRFPLTGVGDVNTYALFAETILQITAPSGRAGFIVPSGIATDDSTKTFFAHLHQHHHLLALFDFENREALFPAVDSRMKFCLLTLGASEKAEFAFFLLHPEQLTDSRRQIVMSSADFRLFNPNTLTSPLFRANRDFEITRNIYTRVPVLIQESSEQPDNTTPEVNPWGISFQRMLDMSNDSGLFASEDGGEHLPLYEAKMIHQFDHRWSTYCNKHGRPETEDVSLQNKQDPNYRVQPRYWVKTREVLARIANAPRDVRNAYAAQNSEDLRTAVTQWATTSPEPELQDLCKTRDILTATHALLEQRSPRWFLGWRDICRATDERTVIASVIPRVGVNHKLPLIYVSPSVEKKYVGVLLGNLDSLVFDYIARQKVGGTSLTYFYFKQLPVLPPGRYSDADLDYIVPRVLELTYTSHDLRGWAEDIGYHGPPYGFDEMRRAHLRAELDAYYARLYGLTRDELRYILDPTDVMSDNYPSETFRVLKEREIREFGKYRTQQLILAAWDQMKG